VTGVLAQFDYVERQDRHPVYGHIGQPSPHVTGFVNGPITRTLTIVVSEPTREQVDEIRAAVETILARKARP
jgi:hypothetical protein